MGLRKTMRNKKSIKSKRSTKSKRMRSKRSIKNKLMHGGISNRNIQIMDEFKNKEENDINKFKTFFHYLNAFEKYLNKKKAENIIENGDIEVIIPQFKTIHYSDVVKNKIIKKNNFYNKEDEKRMKSMIDFNEKVKFFQEKNKKLPSPTKKKSSIEPTRSNSYLDIKPSPSIKGQAFVNPQYRPAKSESFTYQIPKLNNSGSYVNVDENVEKLYATLPRTSSSLRKRKNKALFAGLPATGTTNMGNYYGKQNIQETPANMFDDFNPTNSLAQPFLNLR